MSWNWHMAYSIWRKNPLPVSIIRARKNKLKNQNGQRAWFTPSRKIKSLLPLFRKEGFLLCVIVLIIPLCKGGIKRGISLKNQISLYPSLRKRDFKLWKCLIYGIFCCSTALLLFCSIFPFTLHASRLHGFFQELIAMTSACKTDMGTEKG